MWRTAGKFLVMELANVLTVARSSSLTPAEEQSAATGQISNSHLPRKSHLTMQVKTKRASVIAEDFDDSNETHAVISLAAGLGWLKEAS